MRYLCQTPLIFSNKLGSLSHILIWAYVCEYNTHKGFKNAFRIPLRRRALNGEVRSTEAQRPFRFRKTAIVGRRPKKAFRVNDEGKTFGGCNLNLGEIQLAALGRYSLEPVPEQGAEILVPSGIKPTSQWFLQQLLVQRSKMSRISGRPNHNEIRPSNEVSGRVLL